jgi:ArsR family transcriptional regulator
MPKVKQAAQAPSTAQVCLGLSDSTRLELLARIGKEEVCVCDLQTFVQRDQPTVSRHLAMLRKCGLVEVRKEGRWCHYRRTKLAPALARIVDLASPRFSSKNRSCC